MNGKALFAEGLGTFALVLIGTGAIVVDSAAGVIGHGGIALSFGLVVMVMIYAVGEISGAHFNPAVSLAFWIAGRLPFTDVLPYVAAQCAGAVLGSVAVKFVLGGGGALGATVASVPLVQAFGVEVLLTFLLMFVILNVSTGAKEKGITAGLAIGATVAMGAMVGGPLTGASMNPARSLGPALIAGETGGLWLYILAPVLGAALAVMACRCVQAPGCCARSEPAA